MLNNQQRREILNAAKATGHQGSVLDLFAQAEAGVDVPTLLHAEQDAKRRMEAQQMQIARTQQEQQVGLREEHARGNTGASMAFPDVAPNASFNTKGMKVPINISKFDQQGHLVQSFKDVPPGVQNLPTGPGRGTVIETPAYKYGGYKQKYQNGGTEDPDAKALKTWNAARLATRRFDDQLGGGKLEALNKNLDTVTRLSRDEIDAAGHDTSGARGMYVSDMHSYFAEPTLFQRGTEFAKTLMGYDPSNTNIHELTHAMTKGTYSTPQIKAIQNIPIGTGEYYNKPELYGYDADPEEIYAQLMELRIKNKLDPNKVYTEEDLPELKKLIEKQGPRGMFGLEVYEDKELLRLMNEVADRGEAPALDMAKYGGPRKYQNAGFLTQNIDGFPLYRDLLTGETTPSPSHGYYARAYEGGQPAVGYYPGIPLGLGEAEVVAKKGKYSEAQQAKMRELMANNPDLTDDEIRAQVGAPQGQSIFDKTMSGLDSIEGAVGKTGGGILGQYDPTDPGNKALQDKINESRKNVAIGLSPFMAIPALSIAGPMVVEAGISGIPSLTRTATQAPRYFGNKFLTHTGQALTGVEGGFGSYLGAMRSGQMTTQGLTQLSNYQRAKSGLMSTYYAKSLLGIPGAYNKMYEGASSEFAGKGDLGTRSRFVEGFADVLPYSKGAGFLRNQVLGGATPLEFTKLADAYSRGDYTEMGARGLAFGIKGDQSKTIDEGRDFLATLVSTGRKLGLYDQPVEAVGDLASDAYTGTKNYVTDLLDTYKNFGTGDQDYQDFLTGQETERVNPSDQRMGGPRMYQNGGTIKRGRKKHARSSRQYAHYVEGQPKGSKSTHLMATYESDGKYYVAPTITTNKDGYKKQSFDEALAAGEVYEFKNKRMADRFAQGSWKKKKMQNGGPADVDPVEDYVRKYLNDKFNIDYDKLLDNQKQELRRRAIQDARYLEQTKTRPDLYPELNFNKS